MNTSTSSLLTRRTALVVLATALAAFGGCKDASTSGPGTSGSGKKLTVGFSQAGAESDWRVAETNSVKDTAAARGIELKFNDAQGKVENQITAIRSFIAQGVDAIILAPKVETGWEPVLKEAKAAKIPVILVDRGIAVEDQSLYATLIASDFVAEGRLAAEWLAKRTDGKAKIIELEGSPGAAPAIDRKKGFAAGLAAFPEMKIIAAQSGDFETGKGKEVTETLLQQFGKDVTAIYAHNDNMALGAIEALKAAGKKPGQEVFIVSIDGIRAAFEAMVKGELNCTVQCNPLLGPAAFDAVEKAVKGETLDKKTLVPDEVFDQSTAAAELPKRQY